MYKSIYISEYSLITFDDLVAVAMQLTETSC